MTDPALLGRLRLLEDKIGRLTSAIDNLSMAITAVANAEIDKTNQRLERQRKWLADHGLSNRGPEPQSAVLYVPTVHLPLPRRVGVQAHLLLLGLRALA
jgi:hypothetical protein